jgi:murein L,D-transpeptidase YcbB/YkuD
MSWCTFFVAVRLTLVGAGLALLTPALSAADAVSEALHLRLEELQFSGDLEIEGQQISARQILPEFYATRDSQPAWTDDEKLLGHLEIIDQAPEHGLDPDDYFVAELRSLRDKLADNGSPLLAADLDILLTESLIRYGYHQRFGKVNPGQLDSNINFRRDLRPGEDPDETIQAAIDAPSLQEFFDRNIPRGPIYLSLQQALANHRDMASTGGWPTVPEGPTLHPGDRDSRVVALRQRLAASGDLSSAAIQDPEIFDEPLKTAMIAFQQRHELDADGVVGKQTYMALNVPVEHRIEQLRLSLERLRWVSEELVGDFVIVNIAGFRVFMVRGREIVWTSRVQVGKPYRQTPVFRGDIRYLELNPTWTVPPGILRNDILPAIKRDPNYLASKNISVIDRDGKRVDPNTVDWQSYTRGVPYTLRQEPGPSNALGRIKFIFPNEHFVFLHDTPSRSLFQRADRTFSSGCIRVENPFHLAELILNEPGKWNQESLSAIVDGRKTERIYLDDPMPVLIVYLTATPGADGQTRFMKDPYERDQKVLEALNGEVEIDLPGAL